MVERSQGVARNWAEPERCGSPEELQVRMEEEDRVQRECYPHAGFASRMEAYPGLIHSGRPYDAAWERSELVLGRGPGAPGGAEGGAAGGRAAGRSGCTTRSCTWGR